MHVLRVVHRLADRQLGLVTREQLRECGLNEGAIKRLIAKGVIVRVHRRVYRVPGAADSLEHRALAACLACGTGSVSSDTTAAGLWKLVERPSGLIEVTVGRGRRPSHHGIVTHTRTLSRIETTHLGKIPITTVRRTIVDLPRHLKEEAFDTAIRDGRLTPHAFEDADGYLGELARDRLGLGVPHWKIERRAIEILRRYGLPDATRQHPIGAFRVDLAYVDQRIAIELKGKRPHWTQFQYDIDRSNALKLAHWDEYTFTWWDVTERPDYVATTVSEALSAARSPSRGAR